MTTLEFVRTVFPEVDEEEAKHILWNKTCFPFMKHDTHEASEVYWREQMERYKAAQDKGLEVCDYCGGEVDPDEYMKYSGHQECAEKLRAMRNEVGP